MFGWHRLIKATHQLQIHSRSSAPASNTARDRDAAVQGALPQSLTPVMPHPGLLLTHPTAEPSPVRGSAPSSSPAVASYPESTLPLPPVLKAHQTSRHRRRTPPLTVSPQAHNPLHSPLLGQAGADELLSLARQYGACIDRREPKRPKQELSAKKSDGAHRPVSAIFSASYCFLLLLWLACMRTASPLLQADRNTLEQTLCAFAKHDFSYCRFAVASHAKFLQAVCAVYWHTQSATPRLWTHRCKSANI